MKTPLASHPKFEGPQIQDEEWEKWRDVLIYLYLENGAKLKDIVRIMAEEYNFVVTERQLRYRFFQKWNVKKNIKTHDLLMLSTAIDKQREVGQDVRIEYHGRNIDRDRIERAFKRCRIMPLPSSQDLPFPSGVSMSLDQSFALASEALSVDQIGSNDFTRVSSTGIPFAFEYGAGVGPQAVDDNTSDVICAMAGIVSSENLVRGVRSFGSMSTQEDIRQLYTRTDHLDSFSENAGLVGVDSTEAMDLDDTYMCAPTDSNTVLARNSRNAADWAWTMSPEYCPNIQRNGGEMIANMMERIYLQPHFESPMPTITSLQFPYNCGLPSISPNNIMDGLEVDLVARDGTSFDTTVPSLENLLTSLFVVGSNSILVDVLSDSVDIHGQARDRLPIDQERLTIEIEGLIHWIISSCQRAVVLGQVDKETLDGHALLSIPVQQSNNRDRFLPANQIAPRGETLIEALRFGAQSMFTIEFSIAGSGCYPVESDVITVWSIPSIPYDYQRTIGLRVSFALDTSSFGCRISPHIKTFNVVPVGSSIIECVLQSDLEGVKKLFAEGQASPLDVDPKGNSLLQYAMLHGDSAVFRLLLFCGAGVQSSRYPTYKADFVWTLWTHYLNYVRVPGAPRIGPNRIEDFTECTRMTDAVFESGYDLDEGPYCHPSRPNLLFELARDGRYGRKRRSAIVTALQYLVRKGYDLEERNLEGDTPFLYATMAHSPGAVTRIEAFVEAGSDTSATNLAGQGPLHCALGVPEAVSPADWNIQKRDNFSIPSPSFYQYRIVYSTHHDGPEGYGCHADYICWMGTDGVSNRMRSPVQVLKERSKFKILVLLRAGCDPNLTDKAGETPHQYAERNGLFSQWKWALMRNGYMLDEKSGQWVR